MNAKGVARAMLRHIEAACPCSEVCSTSAWKPAPTPRSFSAHRLYESEGFVECGPFADYQLDPYSRFMTKALA